MRNLILILTFIFSYTLTFGQVVSTAKEREIDIIVYKLYELTYEEVKIIEPEFEMSKDKYENYG